MLTIRKQSNNRLLLLARQQSNVNKLNPRLPDKAVGLPKTVPASFCEKYENAWYLYNRCWEVLRYIGGSRSRQVQSVDAINKGATVSDSNRKSG